MPLLLFITLGTVELGRYFYQGIEVGNAARAGVQYGAQRLQTAANNAGMIGAATTDAKDITLASVTPSNACSCYSTPGTTFACTVPTTTTPCAASSTDHRVIYVQVVATGTFSAFLAYPGIPSPLTISRTAIQQVTP